MMEETAARYSLGSQPRLSLDHLRNLRLEIDALLNFVQPAERERCQSQWQWRWSNTTITVAASIY